VGRSHISHHRSGRLSLGACDVQEARAIYVIASNSSTLRANPLPDI
jgi:hypothetical protein